jgi:hypothetical protein
VLSNIFNHEAITPASECKKFRRGLWTTLCLSFLTPCSAHAAKPLVQYQQAEHVIIDRVLPEQRFPCLHVFLLAAFHLGGLGMADEEEQEGETVFPICLQTAYTAPLAP